MTLRRTHEDRKFMRCLLREARNPLSVSLTDIISGGRTHQHTATLVIERGPTQPTLKIRVNLVSLEAVVPGTTGEVNQ